MGKENKSSCVVLDNTVLTNYGLIRRSYLITNLWTGMIYLTPEVLAEYKTGIQAVGLPPDIWESLPVLTLTPSEIAFAMSLTHRLGAGERSCLAVAVNRNALVATDDRIARQYAKKSGLAIIGSVGILLRNVQRNNLSLNDAQTILDEMISAGYRSPIQRLDEFLF
jgi:predicted nucleic acid-binding protein